VTTFWKTWKCHGILPLSGKCQGIGLLSGGFQEKNIVRENCVSYSGCYRKDLGVDVTSSLKPSVQCSKAVASAVRVLGIIRRNFVISEKRISVYFSMALCAHI